MDFSMRGVMRATMKLVNQLVAIATPTALPLTPGGNISLGMIQLTQPIEKAKLEMYNHTKTAAAQPAERCEAQESL